MHNREFGFQGVAWIHLVYWQAVVKMIMKFGFHQRQRISWVAE